MAIEKEELIAKIKDEGSAFSQDEIYTDFNKLYRKYTIMNKDLGEFFKRETRIYSWKCQCDCTLCQTITCRGSRERG